MTLRVMYELKKISPGSAARVVGLIAAVFYLLTVGALLVAGKTGNINPASSSGAVTLALGAVLTAASGAVAGLAFALLYNLLGRRGGGLRLQFRLLETTAAVKPEDKTK